MGVTAQKRMGGKIRCTSDEGQRQDSCGPRGGAGVEREVGGAGGTCVPGLACFSMPDAAAPSCPAVLRHKLS